MGGENAGIFNTGGNYNLYLAHLGDPGRPTESNTIRLGQTGSQTRAFIDGVRSVTTGSANAVPVQIDSTGQLGTVS
jgi:hypothetical protein